MLLAAQSPRLHIALYPPYIVSSMIMSFVMRFQGCLVLGIFLAAGFPGFTSARLVAPCMWRQDIQQCVWNLYTPIIRSEYAMGPSMGPTARSLVTAAFRILRCTALHAANASTCGAVQISGSPACEWVASSGLHPSMAGLVTSLQHTGAEAGDDHGGNHGDDHGDDHGDHHDDAGEEGTAGAASTHACVPHDHAAVLQAYLDLTTPALCPSGSPAEVCLAKEHRCVFEDHDSHVHCWVNTDYTAELLTADTDVMHSSDVAAAAFRMHAGDAQWQCMPETRRPDYYMATPAALNQEQCLHAPKRLELNSSLFYRTYARLQLEQLLGSELKWEQLFEGLNQTAPVTRTSSPSQISPSTAIPVATAAPQHSRQWSSSSLPACTMLTRTQCAPTLMAVADAASKVSELRVAMGALRAGGRRVVDAAIAAVQCMSTSMTAQAPDANIPTIVTSAQAGECASAALSDPSALQAYNSTFVPIRCSRLSNAECVGAPGCRLEAHGDHFDCVNRQRYVAAMLGGGAVGDALQLVADQCASATTTAACVAAVPGFVLGATSLAALAPTNGGNDTTTNNSSSSAGAPVVAPSLAAQGAAAALAAIQADIERQKKQLSVTSFPIRVAGIFIILVAGVVGCCVPLVFKRMLPEGSLAYRLLCAFSAGMLLCLALVHVGMHSITELDALLASSSSDDPHAGHDHRRALLTNSHPSAKNAAPSISSRLQLSRTSPAAAVARATHELKTLMHSLPRQRLEYRHRLLLNTGTMLRDGDDVELMASGEGIEWQYEAHGHAFPVGACTILFGFFLALALQELVGIFALWCMKRERYSSASAGQQPYGGTLESKAVGEAVLHPQDSSSSKHLSADVLPAQHTTGLSASEFDDALDAGKVSNRPSMNPVGQAVAMHDPNSILISVDSGDHKSDDSHHREQCAGARQRSTLALLFEIGCVMHSFIIGLSLGVALLRSEAVALVIALSFHQLLEGIMLGTLLSSLVGISTSATAVAVTIYALTCPVGVAVGVGIAFSYDSHSVAAMAALGVVNGVAAGMLLYLAFCVIAMWMSGPACKEVHGVTSATEVQTHADHAHSAEGQEPGRTSTLSSALARVLSLVAFAAGIAIFAVIAIWV